MRIELFFICHIVSSSHYPLEGYKMFSLCYYLAVHPRGLEATFINFVKRRMCYSGSVHMCNRTTHSDEGLSTSASDRRGISKKAGYAPSDLRSVVVEGYSNRGRYGQKDTSLNYDVTKITIKIRER